MAQKKKEAHVLCIHIGTAFIRAGISPEGSTELSYVKKIPISFGSATGELALLEHTKRTLKEVCAEYQGTPITMVRIAVSSPWCRANVRSIESSLKQQTSITPETVRSAVEDYKNEVPPKEGYADLEAVAVQVLVHGYPTALKKPVEGSSLSINFYESEIVLEAKEAFLSIITSIFTHASVRLYSFPLAYTLGIREITDQKSFIAVDIGGESSDIVVVYRDAIVHVDSIKSGYYSMARTVGGDSEGVVHDTLSRLALSARGDLSDEEYVKTEAIIEEVLAPGVWMSQFSDIVKDIGKGTPTPQTIFLLSDGAVGNWVAKKIRTVFEHHTIEVLDTSFASSLMTPAKEGGSYDISLALLSIFFELAADDIFGTSEAFETRGMFKGFLSKRNTF